MAAGVRTVTGGGGGSAGSAAGASLPVVPAAAVGGAATEGGVAVGAVDGGTGRADPVGGKFGGAAGAAPAPAVGLGAGAGGTAGPADGTPVAGRAAGVVGPGAGRGGALDVPVGAPLPPADAPEGVAVGLVAATGDETGGAELAAGVAPSVVDPLAGAVATGMGGRVERLAAGGAPFSMRVRSLPVSCWGCDAVWSAARAERIRTLDMAATMSPQPMNGKLRSI